MTEEQRPSLSDAHYMELLERRVLNQIRLERQSFWRFWGVITATVSAAVVGTVLTHYIRTVGPIVQQYEETPFVARLTTAYSQAERLTIVGRAFGDSPGELARVELFYRSGTEDTSTIVLQGEQVAEWTDREITVTTTPEQRGSLLAEASAQDFGELTPYIRVVTADGQRSNLW